MQQVEKVKQEFNRVVWIIAISLIVLLWLMGICHNYGLSHAPKRIRLFKPFTTQNQPLISYHTENPRPPFWDYLIYGLMA